MLKTDACIECLKEYQVNYTGKRTTNGTLHRLTPDGKVLNGRTCFDCRLIKQREARRKSGNKQTRTYEKTKSGFLMRLYRNMQSRVTGVQKIKSHLYSGKSLLDRVEFYKWANASKEFHDLFEFWEAANHATTLTPTVDRINSSLGYEVGNMEWVTHSENSRRGNASRYAKAKQDKILTI